MPHIQYYKAKIIPGLYSFDHYEHPDGSWIQIRHGTSEHEKYIHKDNKGNMKRFSSKAEIWDHVNNTPHDETKVSTIQEE